MVRYRFFGVRVISGWFIVVVSDRWFLMMSWEVVIVSICWFEGEFGGGFSLW